VTFGADKHERADVMLGFGNNLREIRARAGFTQEMLAMRCFMSRGQISAIERGTKAADVPALLVFGDRLGVSVAQLTAGLPAPVRRGGTQQVLDLVRQGPGLSTDALAARLGMPFSYVSEIAVYLQSTEVLVSEYTGWRPSPNYS
jgi:DNA-binding transcriptional regulator YiaG